MTQAKTMTNTEKRIQQLNEEFDHEFFKYNDLKAAAGIGTYFNLISYMQESILNTRTLIKNTRVWFKEFSKSSLLEIFHECNRVLMIIAEKERKNLGLTRLRNEITPYLKNAKWESPPEELSLAFIIGHDIYIESDDTEENEEE